MAFVLNKDIRIFCLSGLGASSTSNTTAIFAELHVSRLADSTTVFNTSPVGGASNPNSCFLNLKHQKKIEREAALL